MGAQNRAWRDGGKKEEDQKDVMFGNEAKLECGGREKPMQAGGGPPAEQAIKPLWEQCHS